MSGAILRSWVVAAAWQGKIMKYFTKFIVLGAASLAMAAPPALAIDKNARGAEKLDTSGRVAKALGMKL